MEVVPHNFPDGLAVLVLAVGCDHAGGKRALEDGAEST
jgi:hypothetical protein